MGLRRSAFTLLELLVCMAIIAVLAALAFGAVRQAMRAGQAAKTVADLRQIGQVMLVFTAENDGLLPQSDHQGPRFSWRSIVKRTLPPRIFRSPLDDVHLDSSYAINDFLTKEPFGAEDQDFSRLQKIPAPSQTLLLGVLNRSQQNSDHFHFASEGFAPAAFSGDVWVELIDRAGLYLFLDGHVERIPWRDLQSNLADPASRFVRPDGNYQSQK